MGPIEPLPNDPNSQPETRQAEQVLQALGQDLEALRHQLLSQLAEEVADLQSRKQSLLGDIESLTRDLAELQTQHQQLQAGHAQALSEQQLVQQEVWAKRLAQALATHLQAQLETRLIPTASSAAPNGGGGLVDASQHLAALDTTLHQILQSLQQDLQSYHSSLTQQVNRMHTMEQQGEAILEALVTRLSHHLQQQMIQPPVTALGTSPDLREVPLPPTARPTPGTGSGPSLPLTWTNASRHLQASASMQVGVVTPTAEGSRSRLARLEAREALGAVREGDSGRPSAKELEMHGATSGTHGPWRFGLILVMLSTLALSIHNVLVGLIGYGGQVFGALPVASIFPLTIPNALMLLWLRMVVVVPLMALVSTRLRPTVGEEIGQLLSQQHKRPLIQVIASGIFLFCSQVLIYRAIPDVGPGVAVTLLFMYPLITVPLAWFLFGDRPTPLRLVVMVAITMGIVFTALPRIYSDMGGYEVSGLGVGAAILSSVAFALYLIAMQLSFRRLHPVPVSLMQFSTVFGLTSLILIVGSFFGLQPSEPNNQWGLYLGGLTLGCLTLLGYLFNNYGVKLMGAAKASIVAASGPVVTAILAYGITPGEKTTLQFIQWMGVVLVTLGVISLSLERLANSRPKV